jgi:hypothetical protein
MTLVAPVSDDAGDPWRVTAMELFGTDDVDAMRAQLDEQAPTLSREEQRIRRGVIFLALADQDSHPNGH